MELDQDQGLGSQTSIQINLTHIQANTIGIRKTVLALTNGQMGPNMKVSLKMILKMVKAPSGTKMEKLLSCFGEMDSQ